MDPNIDRTSFGATIFVILMVCIPLFVAPEAGAQLLQQCYDFIATQFGVLYLLCGFAAFLLLLWFAFGRYGRVKLGNEDDQPEFSTYSWIGMLFCAGVGAGLMYWSCIEWAYYYRSPAYGVEAKSVEAAKWASSRCCLLLVSIWA